MGVVLHLGAPLFQLPSQWFLPSAFLSALPFRLGELIMARDRGHWFSFWMAVLCWGHALFLAAASACWAAWWHFSPHCCLSEKCAPGGDCLRWDLSAGPAEGRGPAGYSKIIVDTLVGRKNPEVDERTWDFNLGVCFPPIPAVWDFFSPSPFPPFILPSFPQSFLLPLSLFIKIRTVICTGSVNGTAPIFVFDYGFTSF